jgi:hydroxymethylpyrimidine pyrophosphatase-like HAD family hydrolase
MSGAHDIVSATAPSPQSPGPALLVSDVDNTLLGDDAALAQFTTWLDGARKDFRVAYNSGRFPRSLAYSVRTTGLPVPDAYIGGVGTEICFVDKRVRSPGSRSLEDEVKERGQVKRPDPLGTMRRLDGWPLTNGHWDPEAVRAVLSSHKELRPQPEHLLSDFKISYFGDDLGSEFVEHLRQQFSNLKLDVDIVYSSDRDLDVLPAGTNKGTAVARLAEHWQIDPQRVFVAGDSGNDLDMFRQGYRGIVVGNALPELRDFKAPNVYHATAHHAAGVLEGLNYWLRDQPAAPILR